MHTHTDYTPNSQFIITPTYRLNTLYSHMLYIFIPLVQADIQMPHIPNSLAFIFIPINAHLPTYIQHSALILT